MKKIIMIFLLVTIFFGCTKRSELVMECYKDGKLMIKEQSTIHSLVGSKLNDDGTISAENEGFDKCIITGLKNE